jgi:hypothetical protein
LPVRQGKEPIHDPHAGVGSGEGADVREDRWVRRANAIRMRTLGRTIRLSRESQKRNPKTGIDPLGHRALAQKRATGKRVDEDEDGVVADHAVGVEDRIVKGMTQTRRLRTAETAGVNLRL